MARSVEKTEAAIVKMALRDDKTLAVLQNIAARALTQMNTGPEIEDTAFKTARNAIGRVERRRALTVFLKTLEDIAYGKE